MTRSLRWFGLFYFVLSGCQAVDSGDGAWAPAKARSEVEEALVEEPAAVKSEPGQGANRVNGDRLWANFESLIGQRYWAKERAATRQMITDVLVASGWTVEEQVFDRGTNLVATYPGLSPVDVSPRAGQILVGAHYDTVEGSPGADDNATGVALLLEIAALYDEQVRAGQLAAAELEERPGVGQRGLVLVFFDQEEQGLLGSLAFTAEPENLESIHSAVVLDMLGASCAEPGCQQYPEFLEQIVADQRLSDVGDFIAVVGEAERPGLLGAFGAVSAAGASEDALPQELPDVLRVPVPFKGLLTPDVLRSDHAAFWLNGVGAVLVTDTANLRSPHYHQPSDDVENVDQTFFLGVAQRVVDGVWRLLEEN